MTGDMRSENALRHFESAVLGASTLLMLANLTRASGPVDEYLTR